jgi:hypothetical protein
MADKTPVVVGGGGFAVFPQELFLSNIDWFSQTVKHIINTNYKVVQI